MEHNNIVTTINLCIVCTPMIFMFSCKKETAYNVMSDNDIISYTVVAGEYDLTASVQQDSIYIYWPWPSVLPPTIKPAIVTGANVSINPASGIEVPLVTGTSYTIKTSDGRQKTFYLKVVKNWPDIEDVTVLRGGEPVSSVLGTGEVFNMQNLRNLIADKNQTKVFLISRKEGKEFEADIKDMDEISIRFTIPTVDPLDESEDEGWWIQVENAGRKALLKKQYVLIPY